MLLYVVSEWSPWKKSKNNTPPPPLLPLSKKPVEKLYNQAANQQNNLSMKNWLFYLINIYIFNIIAYIVCGFQYEFYTVFKKLAVKKYLKVPLPFFGKKTFKNCAKETLCVFKYGNYVVSYQIQQSEYKDLLQQSDKHLMCSFCGHLKSFLWKQSSQGRPKHFFSEQHFIAFTVVVITGL